MNEKYYNYNDLEQMQEKAKKIDYESDKKNFLRSMNPLEQKMALFFSRRPYEVINYLDSFNNEKTNLMLNELNNEEISKLLEQFTSEDKKNFYSTFSNSNLVNKFVANDRNAFNHIDELDFERKIELLDSSKTITKDATEKIYDSLSVEEKKEVETKITSTEGSLVVDNVIENSKNDLENTMIEETKIEETKLYNQKELQEEQEELEEEQKEEKQEDKVEEKKEENLNKLNDFLKLRIQQYQQQNSKFKELDITNPDLFNSLPDDLKEIVKNDFNFLTEEHKEKLEKKEEKQDLLNEFQKSKEDCETEIINNIKQNQLESNTEIVNEQAHVKTL